jgi:translocation and assembly module TamA
LAASSASAARVNVTVEGVSPELQTVILGAVELQQYASREVSRAQVQRLYRRAERQVRYALEPYGYYNPTFTSKLDQDGETYTARLQVDAGPAVTITRLDLEIEGLPTDDHAMRSVRAARSAFAPGQGQPLDHALYERSKAAIHAALIGVGFLDAKLETHRVEVERASNSAHITLLWKAGHRHRFAENRFRGWPVPVRIHAAFHSLERRRLLLAGQAAGVANSVWSIPATSRFPRCSRTSSMPPMTTCRSR